MHAPGVDRRLVCSEHTTMDLLSIHCYYSAITSIWAISRTRSRRPQRSRREKAHVDLARVRALNVTRQTQNGDS